MALVAEHLTFAYPGGGGPVLSDVSLRLDRRERLGLVAPSGQGKTTLSKLLAGYESPQAGTVLLDGRPLSAWRGYCPVQMIWQHPELAVNPRLRLRETLAEGGEIAPQVLSGLGIEPEWMNRFPVELSGGELQRFCIARALNPRTAYLIADEITTMLDLITQSQIWTFLVEETARREIGLLVVSHAPAILERVCTRRVEL